MNIEKRIKYLQELKVQKEILERKLTPINKSIEKHQEMCSHININLGHCGIYPHTGDKYRCLICGKEKDDDFFVSPQYTIHAENYLPEYDIKDEEQCNLKFDLIQTVALGLLKENPDMPREELVIRVNSLIEESISLTKNQNGPTLSKKRNNKKNF